MYKPDIILETNNDYAIALEDGCVVFLKRNTAAPALWTPTLWIPPDVLGDVALMMTVPKFRQMIEAHTAENEERLRNALDDGCGTPDMALRESPASA